MFNAYWWSSGSNNNKGVRCLAWLARKLDYKVDKLRMYEERSELVSTLIYPGTKVWDVGKVNELFSVGDAQAILATSVPQSQIADRIVWSKSTDGLYNVKTGYRDWHDRFTGNSRAV